VEIMFNDWDSALENEFNVLTKLFNIKLRNEILRPLKYSNKGLFAMSDDNEKI
jgi:hypothetical protein